MGAFTDEISSLSEKSGEKEFSNAEKVILEGGVSMDQVADLIVFLASKSNRGITGKLISAVWDNWKEWPNHLDELKNILRERRRKSETIHVTSLEEDDNFIQLFSESKKKDDLADAYLQGIYFIDK
mgnify:CR=1 FL=1